MGIVRQFYEVGKMREVHEQYAGVTSLVHSIDFAIQNLVTVSAAGLTNGQFTRESGMLPFITPEPVVVEPYGFVSHGFTLSTKERGGITLDMSILPSKEVPQPSRIEADATGTIGFFAGDNALEYEYGWINPKARTAEELRDAYEGRIAHSLERIKLAEELGAGLSQMGGLAQIIYPSMERLRQTKVHVLRSGQLPEEAYRTGAAPANAAA